MKECRDLFFWGTAGAGAGGIAGGVATIWGQRGFERAYVACRENRGYTVATIKQKEEPK